ncbi:MAG: zinc ribbon domain-containing protein [Gemmatimonadota bacterium]|nr:zinc ribbon domain-containing protein [Gemmatimonadota bacterium]MDH3366380.1 zinc ribbon domain-containing protein [Gemmatimonadota bacterium]MDH3477638.1 zinc ribbon domain-containing protein [Gemmatimonadota bacterium]MDH3568553.1 zinc ribbon domain-containing protein [Gemmatimonadota bacterium]MDH5549911.1 zinc ribbon domain-containing protein [Gemmatimonadota bacterium]
MLELIAGVLVAFVAVGAVVQPLLVPVRAGKQTAKPEIEFEELEESASPKIQALLALKEIEFDRATGKLSDEDYAELKAKYSKAALDAIRAEEAATSAVTTNAGDAAEELVRLAASGALAVCPQCGPRPETGAAFCSDCGRPLTKPEPAAKAKARYCEACGNSLSPNAKFCDSCGVKVGAQPAGSVR